MTRQNFQRGATIVEAAMVIPILFMFLIGFIEFARGYNVYHVLSDAAREASRFAVAPYSNGATATLPTTTSAGWAAVQAQAQKFAQSAAISNATVSGIDWPTQCPLPTPKNAPGCCSSNPSLGTNVNGLPTCFTKITVSAPYTFFAAPLLFGANSNKYGTIPISSTSTMRQETN